MFVKFFDKRFFAPENEDGTDAALADALEKVDAADAAEDADDSGDSTDDSADDSANTTDAPADDASDDQSSKLSRGEIRIQALTRRTKEAEERAIRAETLAAERERTRTTPQTDPNEARRIRQEKLDLMEPAERKTFLLEEQVTNMQREQLIATIKTEDRIDKSSYDTEVRANPKGVHAKMQDRVEKTLAELRRSGSNAPRETVLAYVIGQKALEDAKAGPKKQTVREKEAAAVRVNTAKAKPASVRADGESAKSGGDETLDQMRARLLAREARGDI